MADIRINALATTAASTASDDFIAVDGSANGTRKLNAYSPTFGGNLTVSGTGTSSFGGNIRSGQLTLVSNRLEEYATDSDYSIAVSYVGYNGGTTRFRDFQIYDGKAGLIASFAGSSKLTTLAGNLTVSGTGETSIAGYLRVGSNTGGPSSNGAFNFGEAAAAVTFRGATNATTLNRYEIYGASGNAGAFAALAVEGTPLVLNGRSGGNVLIGTLVDTGQKLQVSGSAIFGSTNTAQLSNPTGQIIRLQFSASTVGLRLEADSANGHSVIGTSSNHSLLLRSNDTTALTLDSSQNAIFAKDVRVQAATSALTWFKDSTPTKAWGIGSNGWAGLSGGDGSMIFGVYTGSAWSKALELDNATQNATFAGNIKTAAPSGGTAATWRLGTVASVSPTSPNRTIEVEIGGTTYYIHAKTTNN